MDIKKVFINNKETGLTVDDFDIKDDTLYLSARRPEENFLNLVDKIGNPDATIPQRIANKVIKILERGGDCNIAELQIRDGYVTFIAISKRDFFVNDIARKLQVLPEEVVALMEVKSESTRFSHAWIYTVNCRDYYFTNKTGFPECMKVNHK